LSSVGDLEWQKTFRGPTTGEADVWGHDVQPSADGGYLVLTKATETSGAQLGILLKVDAGGAIEWQRTYDGSPDLLHVPNLDAAGNEGFVLSGHSFPNRWVVARVDASGQIEGCGLRDVSLLRMTNSAADEMADATVPLRMSLLVEAAGVAVTNLNLDAVGACRAKAEWQDVVNRIARCVSLVRIVGPEQLPTLYDPALMAMRQQAFTFAGAERVEGVHYAQSWLVTVTD
jgi:hypothetical protein